jgi:hypothetical protein
MDPELVRRVRSGDYVVDPRAVAEAILRRGGLDATPRSDVFEAPQPDRPRPGPEQLEPLPGDDLP